MPWHPPIPAGLATNQAVYALQYKAAVLLLVYCYDDVQRDGWVKVSLRDAADALQEPYETVRRWWRDLRAGPFFCEQIDRGRAGWSVRFSDDWIDWQTLSNNFQRSSMNVENRNINPERSPVNVENRNDMVSFNFQRSSMNVETPAYKVLNNDQKPESHVGGSEDRDGTARTPPPAVALLFEIFPGATISREQGDDVCSTVGGDLAFWREILLTWRTNGYAPRIGNLLDNYRKNKAKAETHARVESHQPRTGGLARRNGRAEPAAGVTAQRWRAYKREHGVGDGDE